MNIARGTQVNRGEMLLIANPAFAEKGSVKTFKGKYGKDVFCYYINNFMERYRRKMSLSNTRSRRMKAARRRSGRGKSCCESATR